MDPQSSRNVALDFLRAFAIVLVMGRHIVIAPESVSPVLHEITKLLVTGGWIGVDLFFVLSGFLVSGILFREHQRHGAVDLKRFFIRRGLKIYPAFWFFFLISLSIKPTAELRQIFGELLFLQNYLGKMWMHSWSLAVEEHFYILLGLFLFFLVRKASPEKESFSSIPIVFFSLALTCLFLRAQVTLSSPFNYETHQFATHLRIDSLMFGVFLSWMWYYRGLDETMKSRRNQILCCIGGMLLLAPAFFYQLNTTQWVPVFGFMLFYLGSGTLMLGMIRADFMQSRVCTLIGRVGVYSYSIYLWHQPINEGLQAVLKVRQVGDNWFLYAILYIVLSLVVGYLAARLVEYPVLKIRDKYFPSRSKKFAVNELAVSLKSPENSEAVTRG